MRKKKISLEEDGEIKMEELILVDENDSEIGFEEKIACHLGSGMLHRAFSVFIFNTKGELLIQKRADEKMLWPGFWSNSCCSHPRRDEDIMDAAARRIVEELGIACSLNFIYKFNYAASFEDIGSEREACHVFSGICDDEIVANDDEISDFRWIRICDLLEDASANPQKYTPWFLKELAELRKRQKI